MIPFFKMIIFVVYEFNVGFFGIEKRLQVWHYNTMLILVRTFTIMKYNFSIIKSPSKQACTGEPSISLPETIKTVREASNEINRNNVDVSDQILLHAKKIGLTYAPWWLHECYQEKNTSVGFK